MTLLARPWDSRSHEKCSFHFSQFWCEIYMQDLGEIYATFMQDVTTRELISLFLWFYWFAIIHVRMLYACRHMSGNEHTKKSDENTKKRRTYTPPPPKLPTQTPISWQPLCRFHWNLSPSFAKNHPTAHAPLAPVNLHHRDCFWLPPNLTKAKNGSIKFSMLPSWVYCF